ncbi:hypothetical protein NL676_039865 [Syzygium grande]|nr:hypothetical protein NL676_039865 [Syzygium grande]
MEMKNNFINHARNVWDRAVSLLPRIDQLWYEYIHTEEKLGNVAGARQIFERWMSWRLDQHGWLSYIKFELRDNEVERVRGIYGHLYTVTFDVLKVEWSVAVALPPSSIATIKGFNLVLVQHKEKDFLVAFGWTKKKPSKSGTPWSDLVLVIIWKQSSSYARTFGRSVVCSISMAYIVFVLHDTFVLQDNHFLWLSRMSIEPSLETGQEGGDSKATEATSMHIYFPCGIIRGPLSNFGDSLCCFGGYFQSPCIEREREREPATWRSLPSSSREPSRLHPPSQRERRACGGRLESFVAIEAFSAQNPEKILLCDSTGEKSRHVFEEKILGRTVSKRCPGHHESKRCPGHHGCCWWQKPLLPVSCRSSGRSCPHCRSSAFLDPGSGDGSGCIGHSGT